MTNETRVTNEIDANAPATNSKANVLFVQYALGQRVTIDAIDTRGIVKTINVTTGAIEYQVAYFDDDKVRRSEWFESHELSR